MSKTLLFSYNPVPTPEYKTVEGSALRFWRMALALQAKGYKDITIAIWEKFPQNTSRHSGINIMSFNDDPTSIKELAQDFDAVIFTCAMGDLSKIIFDAIGDKTRIIIDAYSPMYVEFLTKSLDSKGDQELLAHYMPFVEAFNYCLIRADHILIGNENQKHLYRGVLAGLGALVSHDDDRFITLPAFVEESSRVKPKPIPDDSEKVNVLWFGGVYPWFDIGDLIEAFGHPSIKSRATLRIVGGSNPFYPKDNVRYNGKYIKARQRSDELGLTDDVVTFEDWVEYEERIDVFNSADIAISINNTFLENEYSFRLRVADLVGNGVPVMTNGGDYLGEMLLKEGVAFRLDDSNKESIERDILAVLDNKDALANAKKRLADAGLYDELHIYSHIQGICDALESRGNPGASRINKSPYEDALESTRSTSSNRLTSIDLEHVQYVPTVNLLKITGQRLKKTTGDRLRNIIRNKVE